MKDRNSFKQKLYNYTLPIRDEVWERIEANLPVQKRRFPFLWMSLVGGVLLIGALVIGLSLNNEYLNNETPEKNLIQEFTNNPNISNQEEILIATTSSEFTAPETSTKEISSANSSLKNQQKSITYKSPLSNLSVNLIPVSDEHAGEVVEANINVISRRSIQVGGLPLLEMDPLQCFVALDEDGKRVGLPLLEMDPLQEENDNLDMSSIKPDPSCYKFSGAGGSKALSVDFFTGPGFSPRQFEQNGGDSFYAEAREKTENNQYAWAAGARINLNLQEGLAIRLGLMYEQIGDLFDYTDTSFTKITTTTDSFFDANGIFLYTESHAITIFGTLVKKIHNRYHHIDVPLLLSYELPMGRATIMVNAGPVINLTSSYRGQILDPMLVPKHITPGEPDELKAYKNNLGLSVYLGVGAIFPLTDNISALVEPRFLYRIKPVTLDTYPLKEHRHFAGLNLGIRYHFN